MTRKARFMALIVAAMFFAAMLFSAAFVVARADHDCTGEHCSICRQIAVCQNTLKQFPIAVTATALAAALTYILVWSVLPNFGLHTLTTPIMLKVKLLN